jgi:hypothetical protein
MTEDKDQRSEIRGQGQKRQKMRSSEVEKLRKSRDAGYRMQDKDFLPQRRRGAEAQRRRD